MAIWLLPSPILTLFFSFLLVIQLSFLLWLLIFHLQPAHLPPPDFSLTIPLLLHLPPYLQPAQRASEPASSAESTMARPFCSRAHALLISLSFSMDGIRQKVHGALYCSGVNQGPHLKLHILLVKQAVWWTLRAGLHCNTSTSSEPIGIFAQEKHGMSTRAHGYSCLWSMFCQ